MNWGNDSNWFPSEVLISLSSCKLQLWTLHVNESQIIFWWIWFLIGSPTKNPLTFWRTSQMDIFALPNPAMFSTLYKNLSPKVIILKKSQAKIPLVMGGSRNLGISLRYWDFQPIWKWAISKSHAYVFTWQHLIRWLFEPSQGGNDPPTLRFIETKNKILKTKINA